MSFRSAAELATRPDLMEPPAVVAPPVGVAGRVTLLTLPPKGGKSTTLAGIVTAASLAGVRCGIITLDEAQADTLQRLDRFGANLENIYLDDVFAPDTLEEEVTLLDLGVLGLDHLGKLAELSPDFGPNSQGDPILWGRLVAPFTTLARVTNVAGILVDQARRSDGKYAGSYAKAGTVDVLCELRPKDGGLVGTPRGRIPIPAFRADLSENGCPIFSSTEEARAAPRLNVATRRERFEVLAALQSAEPEGLKATPWQSLACERASIGRSLFFDIRRSLYVDGLVSYTSRVYRVAPAGERALADACGGSNGRSQ